MGEKTFTTENPERTELSQGVFSVVSACSVVRSLDKFRKIADAFSCGPGL